MRETVDILERLVAFDTTSRNSNLGLIDWAADFLRGHGARLDYVRSPDGAKANLFATLGPEGDGGIVLSGHSDVVPVDGQPWTGDPFALRRTDDRVTARGAADMKGFIASTLSRVPAMKDLKRPIHVALSYDEEVGCTGIGGMIDFIRAAGLKPAMVIVGEPTEMRVIDRHKGGLVGTATVRGSPGHSSQTHRTVNAVMFASELVAHVAALTEEMKSRVDRDFDPPYSTAQVNIMHGGTGSNVVPHECTFCWEHRALPGTRDHDFLDAMRAYAETRLVPRMRAVSPATGIDFKITARIPPLVPEPGSPAEVLAKRLGGTNATGAVAFGTEAGFFQELGIPTVVCGPGNIAQAHQPDEFILLSQLAACDRFLDGVLAESRR